MRTALLIVGGLAVVLTLIYIAFQVRQSSKQIDQNARALSASTYSAGVEGFHNWFALIIQDEAIASLWQRGLAGETLNSADQLRFNSMAMMLFTTFEENFHQFRLGAHSRNSLEIAKDSLARILRSPGGNAWWKREARRSFIPEFVEAVEALVDDASSEDVENKSAL